MMKSRSVDWIKQTPIAHRCLHDIDAGKPENSLGAARAAVANGFSIEVDLQRSNDGIPMVFHDNILDRMSDEKGAFRARNFEELNQIKLTGSSEPIPSLKQLLETVDGKCGIVLELKGIAGEDEGFVEAVLTDLKHYQGPVALMSFNHWLLADARRLNTDIPLGLTAEGDDSLYDLHWQAANDYRIDFVSYSIADLPNRFVSEFRAQGKPVISWTIRNRKEAETSEKYADQITFETFIP